MVIRADIRHGLIQPSLRDLGDAKFSVPTLKRWAIFSLSLRDGGICEIPKASSLSFPFCPAPADAGRTRNANWVVVKNHAGGQFQFLVFEGSDRSAFRSGEVRERE